MVDDLAQFSKQSEQELLELSVTIILVIFFFVIFPYSFLKAGFPETFENSSRAPSLGKHLDFEVVNHIIDDSFCAEVYLPSKNVTKGKIALVFHIPEGTVAKVSETLDNQDSQATIDLGGGRLFVLYDLVKNKFFHAHFRAKELTYCWETDLAVYRKEHALAYLGVFNSKDYNFSIPSSKVNRKFPDNRQFII